MDRDTAVRLEKLLEQAGQSITESIEVVRGHVTDDVFHRYCLAIGTILAGIQLDVLQPYVYSEFPDLVPQPTDAEKEFLDRMKPRFKEATDRARRGE